MKKKEVIFRMVDKMLTIKNLNISLIKCGGVVSFFV